MYQVSRAKGRVRNLACKHVKYYAEHARGVQQRARRLSRQADRMHISETFMVRNAEVQKGKTSFDTCTAAASRNLSVRPRSQVVSFRAALRLALTAQRYFRLHTPTRPLLATTAALAAVHLNAFDDPQPSLSQTVSIRNPSLPRRSYLQSTAPQLLSSPQLFSTSTAR